MTQVIRVDPAHPDRAALAPAVACLRSGGLVAFPTETVYGLGADALDRDAVRRIFSAKGRPSTDPLIVHVPSLEAIRPLVRDVPPIAARLAARFWPGPLTLVLPRSSRVPDEVTAGLETVAVRVPAHPVALALLEAAGVPVAAPSANLFSRPSPTRAAHVLEDLDGRVDVLVDGGATDVGVESTVLDLSGGAPRILRPGAVTLEMLRDLVPDVVSRVGAVATGASALPSPGLLERHYSPRAPLTLYEGPAAEVVPRMLGDAHALAARGGAVGLLLADEDRLPAATGGLRVARLGPSGAPAVVAARLYDGLRALDASGVDAILVRGFPAESGLGVAIQDRLRRAAAGRVIRCAPSA